MEGTGRAWGKEGRPFAGYRLGPEAELWVWTGPVHFLVENPLNPERHDLRKLGSVARVHLQA